MTTEISFDENKYKSRVIFGQSETPKMVKFLIGKGLVKNEKSAQNLLISITIFFLLISSYMFLVFVFDVNVFNKTPAETIEQKELRIERVEKAKKLRDQRQNNTTNTQ